MELGGGSGDTGIPGIGEMVEVMQGPTIEPPVHMGRLLDRFLDGLGLKMVELEGSHEDVFRMVLPVEFVGAVGVVVFTAGNVLVGPVAAHGPDISPPVQATGMVDEFEVLVGKIAV